MNIVGQNIIVYDLEIKNSIGNGIGWTDYDKMGISVGCAFDFRSMDYCVYMDDNIDKLVQRINEADIVSGFHIKGFDNPLLNATAKIKIEDRGQFYDLLEESKRAAGTTSRGGMRLDDHLEGTFGRSEMKTENGAEAPLMFQRKEFGRLISYCLADVKREAKLFRHVWEGKPVRTVIHGWRTLSNPKLMINAEAQI